MVSRYTFAFLFLFSIPLHSTNPNLRIFLGAQTVLDGVRREDAGQEILLGVARRRSIFEGKCRLCRESSNTFQTSGSHKENSECDGTQETRRMRRSPELGELDFE